MAGSPGSKARQRRSAASRESRERQWIYLGSAAVLGLVLVVVAVGLVLTWYLPPRAHVLTVGNADFNARDVADRSSYLLTAGNGNVQQRPAEEGIDSLIRQHVLLQAGQSLVGEVSDADVREAIATRLSLAEDHTDEAYANALRDFLRVAPIGRDSFEGIIRAGIVEDRLLEQFKTELPETGEQMLVLGVATSDRAQAQALVEAVRGGQDFTEAALDLGIAEDEEDVVELGWYAPDTLPERLREPLAEVAAGDAADPVDDANRVGFEVYFVAERPVDQPYEEAVTDQLADRELNDFIEDQREALGVEIDLSTDERRWITEQVFSV